MKEKNWVRRIKFLRVDARAKAFAFIDAGSRLTLDPRIGGTRFLITFLAKVAKEGRGNAISGHILNTSMERPLA